MKTVSMLQLREEAGDVVALLRKGVRVLLTYRGRPLARLEPIGEKPDISDDDPFYRLADQADVNLKPLTNEEIDRVLYGGVRHPD